MPFGRPLVPVGNPLLNLTDLAVPVQDLGPAQRRVRPRRVLPRRDQPRPFAFAPFPPDATEAILGGGTEVPEPEAPGVPEVPAPAAPRRTMVEQMRQLRRRPPGGAQQTAEGPTPGLGATRRPVVTAPEAEALDLAEARQAVAGARTALKAGRLAGALAEDLFGPGARAARSPEVEAAFQAQRAGEREPILGGARQVGMELGDLAPFFAPGQGLAEVGVSAGQPTFATPTGSLITGPGGGTIWDDMLQGIQPTPPQAVMPGGGQVVPAPPPQGGSGLDLGALSGAGLAALTAAGGGLSLAEGRPSGAFGLAKGLAQLGSLGLQTAAPGAARVLGTAAPYLGAAAGLADLASNPSGLSAASAAQGLAQLGLSAAGAPMLAGMVATAPLAIGALAQALIFGPERQERYERDMRQAAEAAGYGRGAYGDVIEAFKAGDLNRPTVKGATVGGLLRALAERALAGELMGVTPAAGSRMGAIYFDPTEGLRAILGLTRRLGIPAANLRPEDLADVIIGLGEPVGRHLDNWTGRGRWQSLFEQVGGALASKHPELLEGVPAIDQNVILAPIERELLRFWGTPQQAAIAHGGDVLDAGMPEPMQRWREAVLQRWGITPEDALWMARTQGLSPQEAAAVRQGLADVQTVLSGEGAPLHRAVGRVIGTDVEGNLIRERLPWEEALSYMSTASA